MEKIRDDPIIRCIERTGFPPWMCPDEDDTDEVGSGDLFDEENL